MSVLDRSFNALGLTSSLSGQGPASLAEMALDRRKILLGLEVGFAWALVAGIALTLLGKVAEGQPIEDVLPLAGLLLVLWTSTCLGLFVGGIGRLVGADLDGERGVGLRDAWRFIGSHWAGLAFSGWLVAAASAAAMWLLVELASAVAGVPEVGPTLAGVLIIPVFLALLLIGFVGINSQLVACIMGVERCGSLTAVLSLVRLARRSPTRAIGMLGAYVAALRDTFHTALWSGIVVICGLVAAYWLCGGGVETGFFTGVQIVGPKPEVASFSAGIVFFAWLSWLCAYLTASFALIYHRAVR